MPTLSNAAFYVFSALAIVATALVVVQRNAVHALLYLIVAFLAIAAILFVLGAPFVAALEVIIYAGAIMVLFVFVTMMVSQGSEAVPAEARLGLLRALIGPAIIALALLAELVNVLIHAPPASVAGGIVSPKQVAVALFGTYVLAVELASMLLLAGLVGAYHLGRRMLYRDREGEAA
jgi:NADH-quinone oxidoreductase subunit J